MPTIVPDNPKQGVVKNTVEEYVLNEQYRRMAEHYRCVIVPTRPRKPRDKGAVEIDVRIIKRRAMAASVNLYLSRLAVTGESFLLELIEHRYMDRSMVSCTQYSPADWHGKLGGGVQADAMID